MNNEIIEQFCKTYFHNYDVEFFDDWNFEVNGFYFAEKDAREALEQNLTLEQVIKKYDEEMTAACAAFMGF